MRVLVIKTSSMGDVIHALPALTDARRALPNVVFDWVVEEAFAEIPSWHPAVDHVIPVAIRRWRKHLFRTKNSTEWRQFKTQLRKHHYDLVIDCQGLLKSAWLGSLLKAPVAGMDKQSARESFATFFYRQRYPVPKNMHAVERIRLLFAQALNYELPSIRGNYNIDRQRFCGSAQEPASIVFLHATARAEKLYPESHWRGLAERLAADGYRIRLPWGSDEERERAKRIAAGIEGVEVLPRLNLHGVACVLAQAAAVVAVDTGLAHLSAALNIPTLTLYGPTDPALVGTYGDNQFHLCDQSDKHALAGLIPETVYSTLRRSVLDAGTEGNERGQMPPPSAKRAP
ncbi:lipopolysaccharide heptosyltransferase RfaC [Gilvimarinus sp. F26214L]|uniref:lipopolysaccharide heptosyltransferase RfaC n=1 Tax=Gilvimarinus sp. DZF01 TaxID=3461371 RepID=UPI0040452F9D